MPSFFTVSMKHFNTGETIMLDINQMIRLVNFKEVVREKISRTFNLEISEYDIIYSDDSRPIDYSSNKRIIDIGNSYYIKVCNQLVSGTQVISQTPYNNIECPICYINVNRNNAFGFSCIEHLLCSTCHVECVARQMPCPLCRSS